MDFLLIKYMNNMSDLKIIISHLKTSIISDHSILENRILFLAIAAARDEYQMDI